MSQYQDPDDRGLQWWQQSAEAIADDEVQREEARRAAEFAEVIFQIGVDMMRPNAPHEGPALVAGPLDAAVGHQRKD